jgi:hypothetical protein
MENSKTKIRGKHLDFGSKIDNVLTYYGWGVQSHSRPYLRPATFGYFTTCGGGTMETWQH